MNIQITSTKQHHELADKFYTYIYEASGVPFYVGKGFQNRANLHHQMKSHNKFVMGRIRNLQKKGITANLKIIHMENEDEAFELEMFLIQEIGRKDLKTGPLLNLTDGGEGMSGWNPSEDTRLKISDSRKGEKHPFFGKTLSDEIKVKMSAAQRAEKNHMYGKKHSEETRAKISASLKGKTLSAEHKAKFSIMRMGKNNPNYGKKFSVEHKAKIGAARKGKTHSAETKAKISASLKAINNKNTGNGHGS